MGRLAGTEREPYSLGGEHSSLSARETYTDGLCHHSVLPSLRCICAGGCVDWVMKLGLQRMDLGRGLGLAKQRQPEGPGALYRLKTSGGGVCVRRRKHGPAIEVKHYCEVVLKGRGGACYRSLFLSTLSASIT